MAMLATKTGLTDTAEQPGIGARGARFFGRSLTAMGDLRHPVGVDGMPARQRKRFMERAAGMNVIPFSWPTLGLARPADGHPAHWARRRAHSGGPYSGF